jgi:Bacterial toxin 5
VETAKRAAPVVGGAVARAWAVWGPMAAKVGIAGGSGAGAGAGAGAAGGALLTPAGWVILAVGAVLIVGGAGWMLYEAKQELAQAEARGAEVEERMDQLVRTMWQNGLITDEEFLLWRSARIFPDVGTSPKSGDPATSGGSLDAGPPGVDAPGATPAKRERSNAERNFRAYALRHIRRELIKDPNYVLGKLVTVDKDATGQPDWSTIRWKDASHLSESEGVQAGHLDSFLSGLAERLALEDSYFNQNSSWTAESKGVALSKLAVVIGGLPVELRTAIMWERVGLLPKGTVAKAVASQGWSPRPKKTDKPKPPPRVKVAPPK